MLPVPILELACDPERTPVVSAQPALVVNEAAAIAGEEPAGRDGMQVPPWVDSVPAGHGPCLADRAGTRRYGVEMDSGFLMKFGLPALLLLVACSNDTAGTVPDGLGSSTAPSSEVEVEATENSTTGTSQPEEDPPAPAAGQILGEGWSGFDDTGELEPVPWNSELGGLIIVFPVSEADLFMEMIGRIPSDDELYGLALGTDLTPIMADVIVAPVGNDGKFSFDHLENADYYVCLASGTGPHNLHGCSRVTVAGPAEWTFEAGDGQFDLDATSLG